MTDERTTSSSWAWVPSAARRRCTSPARGQRVLGLERFELGHKRGASHDTSADPAPQLPHAGLRPADPRGVRRLGGPRALVGEQLVTVVGGLDLFPPDPAIPMDDYTASLDEVGIVHELLDVAEIGPTLAAVLAAGRDRRALPGPRRHRARPRAAPR